MANTVTDGRTIVAQANSETGDNGGDWDTLSSTSPTLDTDIKIEGTGSIGEQCTNSRRWLLWDAGATQDWSNNVFSLWVNCGIVGLLATRANAGMSVRFTGPNDANYMEFNVGGSDDWPLATAGGWVQFVVDVEGTPDQSNSPPATTAIQTVGISFITASVMPKVGDNTWIDEIRRQPDGTAGILIQGQNPTGPTDWTWPDVQSELGQSSGALKLGPAGSFILNTSVQFGVNDAVTHGFTDTNSVVLLDEQTTMPTDQYSMTALGNAGGTTRVVMGIKTGTGADATGAQGVTFIGSATDANRMAWDFNDPNLDTIGFYGCTFQHHGAFLLDDPAVSVISSTFIDCSSALVTDCADFLRVLVIDANTADDVGFVTTNDISDVSTCSFEFSDGHAITLTTPNVSAQTSTSNRFTGYGAIASTDSAIYNNSGAGLVTISLAGTSTLGEHTYKNGASASTSITASVPVSFEAVDKAGAAIQDVLVSVYLTADDSEVLNAVTLASGFITTTFSGATPADFYYRYRKSTGPATRYKNLSGAGTIASSIGSTIKRTMTVDNVADPN